MSSAALRFHGLTLAFVHARRERQIDSFARSLRVRLSRRRVKKFVRNLYA